MNKAKQIILDALKTVDESFRSDHGICNLVFCKTPHRSRTEIGEELQKLMQRWPEYSGDPEYPVPSGQHSYHNTTAEEKWSPHHSYGAARRRLVSWMIQELEDELHPQTTRNHQTAPDLTAITTPFGLLNEETKEALKAWPHGWEVYRYGNKWRDVGNPRWGPANVYRAKPAPEAGKQPAIAEFKATLEEVKHAEATNTRNAGTDYRCRCWFRDYGESLEATLQAGDKYETLRAERDELQTRLKDAQAAAESWARINDSTDDLCEAIAAERDVLRKALRVTAAILQAEMSRSGGQPFTGAWAIPVLGIRITCDEALDQANAALADEPSL